MSVKKSIYTSNRKAKSTIYVQEGTNFKTQFATQFELDLFSSAKSCRKKSVFGKLSTAKSVKNIGAGSMLVKRKPISQRYKSGYVSSFF